MSLPELCIRRPIFAITLNLLIVLFGVVGYLRLPVRELPDVDPPIVTITTVYRGASAEVMEAEVTERIEQEVNTIPGIKTLTSISREEVSIITVRFNLDRNVDVAAQDVRDRIARSRSLMPEDIEEPIVAKQDANAQEVLWLALFSDKRSALELTEIGERQFKDRLQTIPGVGGVNFGGEKRQAIRVRLDAAKMAAHEITPGDLIRTFRDNSIELPSGRLENREREMSVRTLGQLSQPEQFENLAVAYRNGAPVRLREIARVELGVEEEHTIARYDRRPAVGLGIVKQSEANAVEVADRVKAEVAKIVPSLPADVVLENIFRHIKEGLEPMAAALQGVKEITTAVILAVLVVYMILAAQFESLRHPFVIMLALPLALLGAFGGIWLLGLIHSLAVIKSFAPLDQLPKPLAWLTTRLPEIPAMTLNVYSLIGIVLLLGLVTKNSILLVEFANQRVAQGLDATQAMLDAGRIRLRPILMTAFSTIMGILPVALGLGEASGGRRPLGVAVVCGMATSTFLTLFIVPVVYILLSRRTKTVGEVEKQPFSESSSPPVAMDV